MAERVAAKCGTSARATAESAACFLTPVTQFIVRKLLLLKIFCLNFASLNLNFCDLLYKPHLTSLSCSTQLPIGCVTIHVSLALIKLFVANYSTRFRTNLRDVTLHIVLVCLLWITSLYQYIFFFSLSHICISIKM